MNCIEIGRTNYVVLSDREGLERVLDRFSGVCLEKNDLKENEYALMFTTLFPCHMDDSGEENDFSFIENVMPYVQQHEVLIFQGVYCEGHKYLGGYAYAFTRTKHRVKEISMNLQDIYNLASKKFKVSNNTITDSSY